MSPAGKFSYKNQREPDEFNLDQIYEICDYLLLNFDETPFPLANNVELLYKNTEKPGLGMEIRTLPESVKKSQAASYLGPYLEKAGIFNLVSPRPAKWVLTVNPKEAIKIIRDSEED